MAVASAVLLASGILRHCFDVHIHHTIHGIFFISVGDDRTSTWLHHWTK
jgi:hypothetical protein